MDSPYPLQDFGTRSRSQVQLSNAHQGLARQQDHHQSGDSGGFQQHGHQTGQPGRDELSSLAMSAVSAVDAVDFNASELHAFSEMFKAATGPPTRSVIPISHPELNTPAPLLLYEPPLFLAEDGSIGPQLFDTRGGRRPHKRIAEDQGSIHSGSVRFLTPILAGMADSSVGNMKIHEPAAPDIQTTGLWNERGILPCNLPVESAAPPTSFGMKEPAQGITRDQEEQTRRPGSDGDHPALGLVENPPDLAKWRQKLFDLENMIVLTQEE